MAREPPKEGMDKTKKAVIRQAARIFTLSAALAAGAGTAAAGELPDLPWEVWNDPRSLPRLTPAHQVLMRSSHCPDGCRFDRHSQGDSRFIRLDGDEGVIFEEAGAGAITRIWMTQGAGGVSVPLDPGIRLRIYLDGEAEPRVDESLPVFFAGQTPPFLAPMVGDRTVSSGGNFSYVPIPFRKGCRVTLTGAKEARIWFQVTYHRLRDAGGVSTFTGAEDLSRWSQLLDSAGDDPWPEQEPAEIAEGQVALAPGDDVAFYAAGGTGLLTGLRLEAPEDSWDEVRLRLTFDGRTTADLSLRDFFAIGRGGETPTRSLLVGLDAADRLYAYFPMPYFGAAAARLSRAPESGGDVTVSYWLRRSARPPAAGSGLFGAQLKSVDTTDPGADMLLLELEGAGKWVGLFADLGSVDTPSRQYLEGDERIYLDGSRHPALYGTGTEDIFGGGFYFDMGPFRAALHGMSYHLTPPGEDVTAAYRLFLTDAVTFGAGIRAGLETGPTGEMPMRARTVAYAYRRRSPALARRDVLELSDEGSLSDHQFEVTGDFEVETLAAAFEGEPPRPLESAGYYRQEGEASFVFDTGGCLGQPRLRRLLDAGHPGQAAIVRLDGAPAAILPPIDPNVERRWREIDVDLAAAIGGDQTTVTVAYGGGELPPPLAGSVMTEFRYELWCLMDVLVFEDGFESGDASAWSSQVGTGAAAHE